MPSLPGILLLCAILAIIARSSDAGGVLRTIAGPEPSGAPPAVAKAVGWSPTALRTAEELARKIAASSISSALRVTSRISGTHLAYLSRPPLIPHKG